jgi:hypothetical protein
LRIFGTDIKYSRHLHIPPNAKAVPKADHPVFDGQPLQIRALIAVAIGCDANTGGVPGVGPARMTQISASTEEAYPALLRSLASESKKHTERELEVLAQSITYDPGNCTDEDEGTPWKHLCELTSDSRYHKEFVTDDALVVSVKDDVKPCACKGVRASSPHQFLRSEGIFVFKDCDADLCRFCHCVNEANVHIIQCLPCSSAAVAGACDNASKDSANASAAVHIEKMRSKLVDANILEARVEAAPHAVLDLYDEYIWQGRANFCEGIEDETAMPLKCSNALDV